MPYLLPTMADITPFLIVLLVAGIAKFVVTRLFFERVYPLVQLNQERSDRAQARIADLGAGLSEQKRAELAFQHSQGTGFSFRPLGMFFAGLTAIWLIALVGSWVAVAHMGGALSEPIWWVAWVFIGGKLIIALPSAWRKGEGRWSTIGCWTTAGLVFLVPPTVMYSLAPVGVVIFAIIYWCLSWVLWRVFPYNKGDVPKVAMLFL